MPKESMIEMCDCGEQFTVTGITSEKYRKWKTFDTRPLATAFPKMTSQHTDQLLLCQCAGCYESEWGALD